MAVRTRIADPAPGGPTLTDTVGEVVAVGEEHLTLATRRGEVRLPLADVVAARVIPPRPSRRGAPHRAIGIEDLHLVMTQGNPGLEVGWLGEPGQGWMLRAGGGYTGRANSALPLGDPGMPDDEAVERVVAWYRERDLVPLVQVPLPTHLDWSQDPFAAGLMDAGWRRLTPTLVMTGRSEHLVSATVGPGAPTVADARVEVTREDGLTDEWLAVASPVALARAEAARAVLSAPRDQAFLIARDPDGTAVGVARVALDAGWAGLYGVHVVPGRRRRGIGVALTAAAGRIALERGVVLSYLQVEEPNTGAVALYERAGLTTHHRYAYLRLDG